MSEKDKDTLSNLEADQARSEDASRILARSKAVRLLRLIFPIVAVAILFGVFAFNDRKSTTEIKPIEEVAPRQMGANELIKPKYRSEDDKDQPYTIEAERAFQTNQDENFVKLESPTADLGLNDGSWLNLESQEGYFDQENQILDLQGDVGLTNDDGYKMSTSQIYLNMKQRRADTDQPVNLDGPDTTIDAAGFSADTQSSTFTFKGPARMIIHDNKTETGQ